MNKNLGRPKADWPEDNEIFINPLFHPGDQEEETDVVGLNDDVVLDRSGGQTRPMFTPGLTVPTAEERKEKIQLADLLHLSSSLHQTLGWTGDNRLLLFTFLLILTLLPFPMLMLLLMLPLTLFLSFLLMLPLTLFLSFLLMPHANHIAFFLFLLLLTVLLLKNWTLALIPLVGMKMDILTIVSLTLLLLLVLRASGQPPDYTDSDEEVHVVSLSCGSVHKKEQEGE